jgi:hypothetical protein
MHPDTPHPREPTLSSEPEVIPNCCGRIARECIEKTLLVEQYLLPLLQHHDVPGGIVTDFKRRWREASLLGKTMPALRTIARRHNIPVTPDMTDQDLRTAILDAEDRR